MLLAAAASSVLLPLKIIHSQLIAHSIMAPLHTDLRMISNYVHVWSEGGKTKVTVIHTSNGIFSHTQLCEPGFEGLFWRIVL